MEPEPGRELQRATAVHSIDLGRRRSIRHDLSNLRRSTGGLESFEVRDEQGEDEESSADCCAGAFASFARGLSAGWRRRLAGELLEWNIAQPYLRLLIDGRVVCGRVSTDGRARCDARATWGRGGAGPYSRLAGEQSRQVDSKAKRTRVAHRRGERDEWAVGCEGEGRILSSLASAVLAPPGAGLGWLATVSVPVWWDRFAVMGVCGPAFSGVYCFLIYDFFNIYCIMAVEIPIVHLVEPCVQRVK